MNDLTRTASPQASRVPSRINPTDQPRLLYSRREASYMLSESLRSIDYKLASGRLRFIRQGGRVKIPYSELLRQAAIDDNTPVVPRRTPVVPRRRPHAQTAVQTRKAA